MLEPNLVVTRDGIPVADQAQGVKDFLAACQKKPDEAVHSSSEVLEFKKKSFWLGALFGMGVAVAVWLVLA